MAQAPQLQALVSGGTYAGQDQGIDVTDSSGKGFDIHALGNGVITRLLPTASGWPGVGTSTGGGLITYRLTDGPFANQTVYVAENINIDPRLKIGDPIKTGQTIARSSGVYPGIEAGFADSQGRAYGNPSGGSGQPYAVQFQQYVNDLSSGKYMYDAKTGAFAGEVKKTPPPGFLSSLEMAVPAGPIPFAEKIGQAGYYVGSKLFKGGSAASKAVKAGGGGVGGAAATAATLAGNAVKVGAGVATLDFLATHWQRGLEVIAGFVLIVIGVIGITREVNAKAATNFKKVTGAG